MLLGWTWDQSKVLTNRHITAWIFFSIKVCVFLYKLWHLGFPLKWSHVEAHLDSGRRWKRWSGSVYRCDLDIIHGGLMWASALCLSNIWSTYSFDIKLVPLSMIASLTISHILWQERWCQLRPYFLRIFKIKETFSHIDISNQHYKFINEIQGYLWSLVSSSSLYCWCTHF